MSERVLVLRDAVVKITQMLSGKGIRVTQRGMTAYVKSDQKGRPIVVNLPYLPDNATDELCFAIQGFLDHEVAHILFTEFALMNEASKTGAGTTLNMLEDARIEKAMAKRFAGCASNLATTGKFFLDKYTTPMMNEAIANSDSNKLIGVLMVPMIRAMAGQFIFQEFMSDKMSHMKPVHDKIADLQSKIENASSTQDCLDLANEIQKRLRDPNPGKSKGKDKKESGGEGEGDGSSSGKGSEKGADGKKGGKSKSKPKPKPKPEEDESDEGEGAGGESEDEKKSEDESEGGKSKGEKDESEDESEKDESDGESEKDEGEPEDEDEDESDKDDGASSESEDDSEDEGDEEDDENDGGESSGSGDGSDSDTEIGDTSMIADAIDKENANGFDENMSTVISSGALSSAKESDYLVYTKEDDVIEPLKVGKDYRPEMFVSLADKVNHMVGPLQKDLERAIAAKSLSQWENGRRSGRLHSANLSRLACGDDRVFRRKHESTSKDVAVSLVIDASGSMSGSKVHLATQAAYALSSVLERIGIKHEVICFTTGQNSSGRAEIEAETAKTGLKFSRVEPLYMPILKSFDERLTVQTKDRFGWLPNSSILRNNVDGECIEIAAQRLKQRREAGKVMIVLSDGAPNAYGDVRALHRHLKQTVKDVIKSGVNVIGIGIESEDVKQFYPKNLVIREVSELPGTVIKELRHLLAV